MTANNYKIGDKVILKKNLKENEVYGGIIFYANKLEWYNVILTIVNKTSSTYNVTPETSSGYYRVTDEMVEKANWLLLWYSYIRKK